MTEPDAPVVVRHDSSSYTCLDEWDDSAKTGVVCVCYLAEGHDNDGWHECRCEKSWQTIDPSARAKAASNA